MHKRVFLCKYRKDSLSSYISDALSEIEPLDDSEQNIELHQVQTYLNQIWYIIILATITQCISQYDIQISILLVLTQVHVFVCLAGGWLRYHIPKYTSFQIIHEEIQKLTGQIAMGKPKAFDLCRRGALYRKVQVYNYYLFTGKLFQQYYHVS